jgi:transposase-like protein
MGKLATPEWVLKGYKSKDDYERKIGKKTVGKKVEGKTFKVKKCPKCGSKSVAVILGNEEGKGTKGWECKKCKWNGSVISEEEINEEEFLKLGD